MQTTPVKVMDHTAVIQEDGSLWAWDGIRDGQVGNGAAWQRDGDLFQETEAAAPVKIMDGAAVVSCGDAYTAAVKTAGTVWIWGSGDFGKLGSGQFGEPGSRETVQSRPAKIIEGVKTVSCGKSHTAAIKKDGSL